jgi:O-antigen ligase
MGQVKYQLHQLLRNQNLINSSRVSSLDSLMILSLTLFPLLYMTLRGWTNIYVFVLTLLGIIYFVLNIQSIKSSFKGSSSKWVVFTLCSPLLAIALSQFFRQDFSSTAFDGPSRFFLAALIFLYLKDRQINFTKILEWILPTSLIVCLAVYYLNPLASAAWGGRAASYFVDPLTFGSYALILGFMCLISIRLHKSHEPLLLSLIKLIGFLIGCYLAIKSQSRSAWTAATLLLLYISFVRFHKKHPLIPWSLVTLSLASLIGIYYISPEVHHRVLEGSNEVISYFKNNNFDTSLGLRISMIRVAGNLILEHPLSGFKDGVIPALNTIPSICPFYTDLLQFMLTNTGTHNEVLAQGVRSGIWGLISSIALFFIPGTIFIKHLSQPNKYKSNAAILGLALVIGLFITSLTIQVFNLKYTSSFYALMIAALTAQTLQKEWNESPHE